MVDLIRTSLLALASLSIFVLVRLVEIGIAAFLAQASGLALVDLQRAAWRSLLCIRSAGPGSPEEGRLAADPACTATGAEGAGIHG